MDIPKVLDFIDEAVYTKTGKPLNDLQRTILEGTLKDQKYSDIGDTNGFSEGHVKDVGYELFQLLSNIFKKPLNKRNLKKFLEKQNNLNCGVFNFCTGNTINYASYYGDQKTASGDRPSPSETSEPETPEYQRAKYLVKIETAKKLRKKGLSDAEIAEILDINIEDF